MLTFLIKYRVVLHVSLLIWSAQIYGQGGDTFDKIKTMGMTMVKPLIEGDVEFLENSNPPKNTWLYSKLLNYKEEKIKGKRFLEGYFISPAISDDLYAFNYFVLDLSVKPAHYEFVAVISISTSDSKIKVDDSYLFTEKKALNDWWMRAVSFYMDREKGKLRVTIPDRFVNKICPPPPFPEDME